MVKQLGGAQSNSQAAVSPTMNGQDRFGKPLAACTLHVGHDQRVKGTNLVSRSSGQDEF